MDALLDYLDDIEQVLDSGSKTLTGKLTVDKERILEIIAHIRLELPDDIRQAQRILSDHDRIVAEAERKAQVILDAAENEAKIKTNAHEIFRRASDQASELISNKTQEARDLRHNAVDYADARLAETETQLREYMDSIEQQHKRIMEYFNKMVDVIYENRQQLRVR